MEYSQLFKELTLSPRISLAYKTSDRSQISVAYGNFYQNPNNDILKFEQDLENNWAVVAEAIQTVLRREGFEKPYEALKGLTRTHDKVTQTSVHEFIDGLDISQNLKDELKKINPSNYLGIQMVD